MIGLGAVGAVAQTADAVTRHYWPLAALACAVVPARAPDGRGRRAGRGRRRLARATAAGIRASRPGPLGHLVAHRLDDLAYGAGPVVGRACGTARSRRCGRPVPAPSVDVGTDA